MLKQRLLTAAVLIPLVLWGVFALPNTAFALALGVFALIGAWEWAHLVRFQAASGAIIYTALVAVLLALTQSLATMELQVLLVLTALWWCVAFIWVLRYPAVSAWERSTSGRALSGVLVLVPAWAALVALHGQPGWGSAYVLYLLVLIWVADSAAYFAGRRFGRRKLAPQVSPGKTWEGCIGALLGALVWALAAGVWIFPERPVAGFVLLSLVTVAFSIVGDLAESLFKRQAGVKDSGRLFPGHGGVLDRVDSVTAAAPLFVLGLLLFGGVP